MDSLGEDLKRDEANSLQQLIAEDEAFVDTPLHRAAREGLTTFAMEILNVKPSFARKLNQSLLSPMHLALLHQHFELALRLLDADREVVRVKGKEGMTPLHFAVKYGTPEVLANLLRACPESMEDVTVHKETVLHIAVRENKVEALHVLVGWLRRVCHRDASKWVAKLREWKDHEGCTAVDIAVSDYRARRDFKAIMLLADLRAVNSRGLKAIKAFKKETQLGKKEIHEMKRQSVRDLKALPHQPGERLTAYLRSTPSLDERMAVKARRQTLSISDDVRSNLLVVAALIGGIVFQNVLDLPKSYYDSDQQGIQVNLPALSNGTFINGTIFIITTTANSTAGRTPKSIFELAGAEGHYLYWFILLSTMVLYYVIMLILLLLFPEGDYTGLLLLLLALLLACYHIALQLSVNILAGSTAGSFAYWAIMFPLLVLMHWNGRRKIKRLASIETTRPYRRQDAAQVSESSMNKKSDEPHLAEIQVSTL